MEGKKKPSRKKNSIGNSMLSLILVLAMVLTNVQIAPAGLSTVWASENGSALPEEASETGEVRQGDELQNTETADGSSETGENAGDSEPGTTDGATEPVETKENKETAEETSKTEETGTTEETGMPAESEETGETPKTTEAETVSETETTEVSETAGTGMTETEAVTETATDDVIDNAADTVTVKAHFANLGGWDEVAVHYWDAATTGVEWPGIKVEEKDENGYYVATIPITDKTKGLGIIFNNNKKEGATQTSNVIIPASKFTVETYECWIWINTKNNAAEVTETPEKPTPLVSPEIEKNTVTFRYKNDSAQTVVLAGNFTSWKPEEAPQMIKGDDGVFTYKIKLQCDKYSKITDGYQYKYVVDGDWVVDPYNENDLLGGNSTFSIETLLSPEINGYDATFYRQPENDPVEKVFVAGSFTDWRSGALEMTKGADGIYTLTCKDMAPGDYEYKFVEVVGGEDKWYQDPNNDLKKDDGQGTGSNSLFTIGDDLSKTYTYTINYYNPAVKDPATAKRPDLLVWNGRSDNTSGKAYDFNEELLDDAENGIKWLTTTVKIPYKMIGMNGRLTAGKKSSKKDADRKYTVTDTEKTEVTLWYVYGKGIYDKKPAFGKVEKVEAKLQNPSMNYTQNNVLTLTLKNAEGTKVTGRIREAYVDASELGMSSKLAIDVELLEVTLSVREGIGTGKYTLPITVVDFYNNKKETSVEVEITNKGENDFDWDKAVIYFMVTDRFFDGNSDNNAANGENTYGKTNAGLYHGGDFAGVTAKLDYLKELGVNTIWITPIVDNIAGVDVTGNGKDDVPFNASYHGYWAQDFTKLDPSLGTEDEFKALIEKAHNNGIKIMVDVVLNHAGYRTEEYFNNLLKDADGNFIQMIRDESQMVSDSDQQTSLSGLPDFLTENEVVRNQLVEWQVNWMKNYNIDYFRVDTVKHAESTTWSAFKNELTKVHPEFKMIGEYYGAGHSWNGGSLGSGQMDSVLDFNFNDYATDFVKGNIASVEGNLRERNNTLNNTYMTGQFLSSHDEVGFKQNLLDKGWEADAANAAALVAATLQITAKGQPVIYYGEEIGQTGENNYPYQTNRYDFNWTEAETQKAAKDSVYSHYSTLLKIRSQYSDIFAKGDRQSVAMSNADGYDVVSRTYDGQTIYIGMNLKAEAQEVTIPISSGGVKGYDDLYSQTKSGARAAAYPITDGKITVIIPAAKDGGTVILVPTEFKPGLIAPEVFAVKGRECRLPAQLVKMAEDGTRTNVDVAYSVKQAVEGVTLDAEKKILKVEETCAETEVTLIAAAGDDAVEFPVKIYVDNNKITLKIYYHRGDEKYEGWNIWGWKTGSDGSGYEFEDEDGKKVVTIELDNARANSDYNCLVRKRAGGNEWAEQGSDQKIDLSEVLSGTVYYYIEDGKPGGTRVLGDDVLTGAKIVSVDYNSEDGHIIVKTKLPITGNAKEAFALKSSAGELTIKKVNVSNNVYELITAEDLTTLEAKSLSYTLTFDGYEYAVRMPSAYSTEEFEDMYTYEGNDLGATWTKEKTTFKVWAPTADKVLVNLYESGTQGTDDLKESLEMTKGEKGVWSAEKAGDLNGVYYTYSVTVGSKTTEACDPYAVTTGVNGNRAMVIDLSSTNPKGWDKDSGTTNGMKYTDAVIYELHVRDFSIDESSGIENKGKFLGLTETGTTSPSGEKTGLDYLVDLGVTHLHLLPSYDYATVDETRLDEAQYNWGYDPKNYNVPEGSYSTNPYRGDVRVKEMKQMVKTLHDNNINVIMDVVYNHVYSANDFCFNQIVPQYFSRTNADGSYSNGSGCGNDTASERSMVKKYIVDSVNYWADEYHIDGFRFDLVGLIDTETMNEVVETVHKKHPNVIFYGEGWTMDTSVTKDGYTMTTQKNSAEAPDFAFFSDTMRDFLKGSVFDANSTGFISIGGLKETVKEKDENGNEVEKEVYKAANGEDLVKNFIAEPGWSSNPAQIVNYASCHDNYTLKDKLNVSRADATEADRIRMNNLAAAIYMMSEGIPLIHAGEEILRTKVDEGGNIIHNSYNSSDYVNSIKWSDLDKYEYREVRDYYKGLIAFRKNHAAVRLASNADVKKSVTSYPNVDRNTVMFVIKGKGTASNEVADEIVVIFNADAEQREINLYDAAYGITQADWNVCINDEKAGTETIQVIKDGKVIVAPISAMVLVKGEQSDSGSVYDKGNREGLKTLVDGFKDLTQGEYTDESWSAFQEALKAAQDCLANENATAEELIRARQNLMDAYAGLVLNGQEADSDKTGIRIEWASGSGLLYKEDGLAHAVYTGKAMKPAVKVYDGKKLLKEKTDYTVSYKNNVKAGTATVTVKGKGNYNELDTKDFIIDKMNVSRLDIEDMYKLVAATNSSQVKLKPVVKYNGKNLKLSKDYTAAYENESADGKTPGEYKVIITGQGENFTGSKTVKMILGDKSKCVLMGSVKIGKIDPQTYDGNEKTPVVKVTYKGKDVPETDYTVDYANNTAVGTATVIVKGTGTTYLGTKTAAFKINGKPLKANMVTLEGVTNAGLPYAGKALKPEVKVNDAEDKVENSQYTVAYQNNINAGKATVIVTGRNGYTGVVKKTFKITPYDISGGIRVGTLPEDKVADIPYAKGGSKLDSATLKARFEVKSGDKVTKTLAMVEGRDYTLSYKDNKKTGTATATIKGKGNYKGTKPVLFTIVNQDINNLKGNILAADIVVSKAAKYNTVVPVIKDLDGKALKKTTDFTVDGYTYADDSAISGTPAANSEIKVKISGAGYYAGSSTYVTFRVIADDNDIAKWKVSVTPQTYTGKEVVPSRNAVTVESKSGQKLTADDFEIIGCTNNIKKGTAKITIHGLGNYGGTKTVTFKITARPIKK